MSMLSVQCDKLRKRAAELRQGRWSDGADDAALMDEAADTIDRLRCDTSMLLAERQELRELVRDMRICLRRAEMYGDTHMQCSECELLTADCDFETRMRQLGIEVN